MIGGTRNQLRHRHLRRTAAVVAAAAAAATAVLLLLFSLDPARPENCLVVVLRYVTVYITRQSGV